MRRTKWLLAAFLIAAGGNPIALANPPANPGETVVFGCLKLPPLWHGVVCLAAGEYDQAISIGDELLRDDPDNQRAYALRGYAHFLKKNEDRLAIADLTEALRCGPDNAVFHVIRAQAYERVKEYDRAIADCTVAIRIDPNYGEAYAWRAGCYLEKRITNKAIADYTLALRHAPYLAWARCGRAEAYRRRGESARALADLEEVLRDDPDDEQAHFNRCIVYLNNRHECDQVIAESSECIRRYSQEPHCWYALRSTAYLFEGETAKALRDWAKAVALKPEYFHLRCTCKNHSLKIGYSFGRTANGSFPGEGDPDERIAACTKRLAEDPNNVAAYYERSCIYYNDKRDCKRAVADLNEIIRRDPADTAAYFERSQLYLELQVYAQAIADCTKAIQIDPDNADYYYLRARVYSLQGKDEDALREVTHALQLEPRIALAHVLRGWLLDKRKDHAAAIEDYSEAIRHSPVYADAYLRRAWSYCDNGEYAEAIADFKKTLELDPQNLKAHRGLGWYLATSPDAKLRDGKEAQKHATTLCEETKWKDATYLSVLAAACAECGDFDQAIKWQTRALELAPEATNASHRRRRLELYRSHRPYHEAAAISPSGPSSR